MAYHARDFSEAMWIDRQAGIVSHWSGPGRIDWRFPWVARIPDAAARDFLLDWLDQAQGRELTHGADARLLPRLAARASPAESRLLIGVFGSCARGPAPPKSDLDVLMVGDWREMKKLGRLGHEVALNHPRQLSLQTARPEELPRLAPTLVAELARDLKTVWSNDPNRFVGEALLREVHAHG